MTRTENEKVITIPQELRFPHRYINEFIVFTVVHYIFWFPFVLGFLYLVSLLLSSLVSDWTIINSWLSPTPGFFFVTLLVLTTALYLPSFLDGSHVRGGRPWNWLRRHSFWLATLKHCGVELVRTVELSPKKKYVFGYHPHGILVLSRVLTYGGIWEQLFPGIDFRVLGATPMFFAPFCREICLWMGAIDASKSSAERALKANKSLIIYPGGSKEIFETTPKINTVTLVLKERKGFVKLAMQHGADLVPVVVFGEKEVYNKLHIPEKTWKWFLKQLKVPLLLFWGKYFTWIPLRKPMHVIFGEPIPVEKIENPTQEQVDQLHQVYMDKLEKFFNVQKQRYSWSKDLQLNIT